MVDIYSGKRVLILGNTGFTGAWLSLFLHGLNCRVYGYARGSIMQNNFGVEVNKYIGTTQYSGDITDRHALLYVINECAPDIIFHLAGQPLIGISDTYPAETVNINAIGTLCLLDIVREQKLSCKVVVISSDKCYKVTENNKVYKEIDEIGGTHTYAISKVMQEQFVQIYSNMFSTLGYESRCCTIRPGNIIGGGDFSRSRLIPDIMNAIYTGDDIFLRDPKDIRSWTYIIDAIYAYLLVAKGLLEQERFSGSSFNVGPTENGLFTTLDIAQFFLNALRASNRIIVENISYPMHPVLLSTQKIQEELGWYCSTSFENALKQTARWYQKYFSDKDNIIKFTMNEIENFMVS